MYTRKKAEINPSNQFEDKNILNTRKQANFLLMLVCLLLSFTFCVFGPLQLYLANISELWFPLSDLWLILALCGAAVFGILYLIGRIIRGKSKNIYICIVFGLAIGFYLQGNVIGADYGLLNGVAIDWESYTAVGIANTLIWIACVAAPLIIYLAIKQKKLIHDIVRISSICIVLLEVVTLFSMAVTTDIRKDKTAFYSSYENLNKVSKNDDTVIFVLDTFDEDLLEEVLADDPDYLDEFDGFTRFSNATSAYPTTKFSMPYILTGQYYENNQSYNNYIKEAWQNTGYYKTLKSDGCSINIYSDGHYVSRGVDGLVDNMVTNKIEVSSYLELANEMYRFTAFRYLPHYAKKYVWFYSGVFKELKKSDGVPPYTALNADYIESLKTQGLELSDSDEKIYKFIYLVGAHPPYVWSEDMQINTAGVSGEETAKGCLNIMKEYIRQLKELNVYDSTTIIITADHGVFRDYPTSPIILAKQKGARGQIKESNAPVSHSDLMATVLKELNLDESAAYGESIFDIQEGSDRQRRYLYYNWEDNWYDSYAPDIYEYEVAPGGNDLVYFNETGRIFTPKGVKETDAAYHAGDPMVFGGWTSYGKYSIQKESNAATIELKRVEGAKGNLLCQLRLSEVDVDGQNIVVSNAGNVLYQGVVTNNNPNAVFWLPQNCIDNGKLVLKIECTNAAKSGGEYPLMFSSISLTNNEQYKYHYGDKIVFTKVSDGTKYFAYGLGIIETDAVWTSGYSSKLLLYAEKPDRDLVCTMKFRGIYPGSQRMVVKNGGTVLFDETVSANELSFAIPKECASDGAITLDFEYPGAISPREYEKTGDIRILAFSIESIVIDRTDTKQQ